MNHPPNDARHLSDELLSERLDAALDAATMQRIDAHLATCAECSARYAGLKGVRVALQGLREVAAVPDFRLSAQGQPRRRAAHRVIPATRPGAAWVGRLASAAVLFCGIVLIALTLQSGSANFAARLPSAASTAGGSYANCPSVHCASTITSTTPVTQPGTAKMTPPPTLQPSMPGRGTSSYNSTNSSPFPWSPLTLVLGVLLAVGGFIALVRPRRR